MADLRAPTPSAAGELAVPDILEVRWKIENINNRLSNSLKRKLENMKDRFNILSNSKVLKNPYDALRQKILFVDNSTKNLENIFSMRVKDEHIKLVGLMGRLDNLSPLKTMARGYSVVEKQDGKLIKSVDDLISGEEVAIRLSDGKKMAKVL